MNFDGKNIIVTGGASGIGRAVVNGIVSGGGHAIIVDINLVEAESAVKELGCENASAYKADLSNSDEIKRVYGEILKDKAL